MDEVRLIEQDDPGPFCPLCGRASLRIGGLCDECATEDPAAHIPEVCHCGLSEDEHVYPTVGHNFVPKRGPEADSEESAFIRAIVAAPKDAALRLIFADWLDDHGQDERAKVFRKDRTDCPPCRVCGLSEKVIGFSDKQLAVCPDCCDEAEHADGETGHGWDYDQWERGRVCRYCGIPRSYTDYDVWEFEGDL